MRLLSLLTISTWVSALAACAGTDADDTDTDASGTQTAGPTSGATMTTGGTGGETDATDSESTTSAGTATSDATSTTDTTSTTDPTSTTAPTTDPTDATDGTETSDTTGEPPADACAETVLPEGNGVEIIVKPSDPGMVEVDGKKTTLRSVVQDAQEGDTILLEDGLYTFTEAQQNQYTGVYFTKPNVTLRSLSGDASAVILDSEYKGLGGQSGVLTIDAPGVVVADITVRRSIFHLVHLWANADDVILHNLELVDGGQQFIKSSTGDGEIDGVQVSCSRFLMTDEGRDNVWGYGSQNGGTRCYTGGIDTHEATNWTVRDNLFSGIYCDAQGTPRPAHGKFPELRDGNTYNGGLSEHAIHMWDSIQGTGHTLTRNRIINCARGIGLGFVNTVHGTTITNNTVFSEHAGSGEHDVGISVERGVDTIVAHNTVFLSHPESYSSGIEYRWGESNNLTLHGNLSNRRIRARDGATAALSDNVAEMGDASWFVDAAAGDLHLADCAAPGEAGLHPDVPLDLDAEARSEPTTPGADQCSE